MGNWDMIISEIFAGSGDLFVTLWNKPYDKEPNILFHPDLSVRECPALVTRPAFLAVV